MAVLRSSKPIRNGEADGDSLLLPVCDFDIRQPDDAPGTFLAQGASSRITALHLCWPCV